MSPIETSGNAARLLPVRFSTSWIERDFDDQTKPRERTRLARARGHGGGCGGAVHVGGLRRGGGDDGDLFAPQIIEANLTAQAASIGGATSAATYFKDGSGDDWTLYSMSNRLAATKVGVTKGAATEISLPGYIQHITPVKYGSKDYALVSMGGKGLAVVDLANPAAMVLLKVVQVNYEKNRPELGGRGGTPVLNATVSGTAGVVLDALVDDRGTASDFSDDELFIANGSFGIHKTKLSNLLADPASPVLDASGDGTLKIDAEVWTLQYAGENPWGAPASLKLHNGKLYAALGFLGIAIYDASDLAVAPARYNLYTDESVSEDWFGGRRLSTSLQDPSWVDPDTGMPSYLQAQWEIDIFWRENKMDTDTCQNSNWCTPGPALIATASTTTRPAPWRSWICQVARPWRTWRTRWVVWWRWM